MTRPLKRVFWCAPRSKRSIGRDSLLAGDAGAAAVVARNGYPFAPPQSTGRLIRSPSAFQSLSGMGSLIVTTALACFSRHSRLLSRLLPMEFPYHPIEDERKTIWRTGAISDR